MSINWPPKIYNKLHSPPDSARSSKLPLQSNFLHKSDEIKELLFLSLSPSNEQIQKLLMWKIHICTLAS